ncbi:MAG: hypothetical protein KKA79_07600, partial [Nanoarchaeota archaeon]|nr:hypothetical protein [Nanoarchaeota archaeon]
MITNINCIKGVGKFSNCNSGGITFTNKVLIFGKNTHGKSTLTDIFSSLRNGNNDLIIGRKTFRFTNKQEVIIKAYGKEYIFQNSSWNDVLSNLEIFDTKFITDNVCNTENISFEQQQKLNGVILGDKGQKTLSQINDLTEQITKLGVQKRNLTSNFFNPIITSMISLEEFLELNENEDIGAEIEKKQ